MNGSARRRQAALPVSGGIRLKPVELLACWEAMQLRDPPFLLQLSRPTGTRETRAQADRDFRAALVGLEARGLTDGRRPVSLLAEMLHTMASSDHLLDIRFTGPAGRPVVGLGAVLGERGVTAVSPGGHGAVELHAMDGSRVASRLIGLLGPVHPGVAPCVNLPADVFDRAAAAAHEGSPWDLADELTARGVPRRDATASARMLTGITFGGQLGITTRRGGADQRGPWVVGFLRNGAGRHFVQLRRQDTVTIGPADADRLLRHWGELLDQSTPVPSG